MRFGGDPVIRRYIGTMPDLTGRALPLKMAAS